MLKAAKLSKKNDEVIQTGNLYNLQQEAARKEGLVDKETDILETLEREFWLLELKDMLSKKASGGIPGK